MRPTISRKAGGSYGDSPRQMARLCARFLPHLPIEACVRAHRASRSQGRTALQMGPAACIPMRAGLGPAQAAREPMAPSSQRAESQQPPSSLRCRRVGSFPGIPGEDLASLDVSPSAQSRSTARRGPENPCSPTPAARTPPFAPHRREFLSPSIGTRGSEALHRGRSDGDRAAGRIPVGSPAR